MSWRREPEAIRRLLIDAGWLTIAAAVVVWMTLWMRVPVDYVQGFQNEDVAGITYNADLLLHGLVPLKDNLEYKAPGAFFLTAFVFSVFERSVSMHEQFGVFWSVLAALGMLVGGRVMFGRGAGLIAALLYAYFSPITDSMTVNYNSWMIAPYIWATVFLVLGLRRSESKKSLLWLVGAGFLAVMGALMKRQGAMIVPAFGLLLLIRPALQTPIGWRPPRRWPAIVAFGVGVVLGFLPIAIYYLANGGLSDFVASYFGSGAGWDYVQGQEVNVEGKLDRLEDGLLGAYKYLAFPMVLATASAGALVVSRYRKAGLLSTLLGLHLAFSFVGVALGFRFYKGYYLQLLPAAAWLAVHREGPLMRLFRPESWPRAPQAQLGRTVRGAGLLLLCLPTLLPALTINKVQSRQRPFQNRYQIETKTIAKAIRENTTPRERIWVWGRWAWPVYFYADRLSSTRYYKVLGLITTNLTNTWRRATSMTRFVKKGPWREIGRQLATRKPVFIVAAKNESYQGFTPLETLLREHYRLVAHLGVRDFNVYLLKGRTLKGEPAVSTGVRRKLPHLIRARGGRLIGPAPGRLGRPARPVSQPTRATGLRPGRPLGPRNRRRVGTPTRPKGAPTRTWPRRRPRPSRRPATPAGAGANARARGVP